MNWSFRRRRSPDDGEPPQPREASAGAGVSVVLRRYPRRSDVPAAQDAETHRVADLLLRLGDIMVASGAATSDVEAAVIATGEALGVHRTEVDVTFNAVTVTLMRVDGPPVTQVRVVRHRSANHARLTAVHRLIVELVQHDASRREASAKLAEIEEQAAPYPRWLVSLAWGGLAAAVTVIFGGGPLIALIAFGTTGLVDQLGRILNRQGWPQFFLHVVGAFVATSVTVLLWWLDVPIRPSLVVIGGIIVLLSGMAIVATVQDAITGFLVTAAGRGVEVVLLTAGIITGVALGLFLAQQIGVTVGVIPPRVLVLGDVPAQIAAAGFGATAFAVAYQTPRRLLAPCGLAGITSYVVWAIGQETIGAPAASAAAGAMAAGLLAQLLANRLNAPPLVVVIPAIVMLLPGLTIYRGMLLLSEGATGSGLLALLEAGTIGLALAAGVILGEIIGQPVHRELSRFERRFARPRLVGPQQIKEHRRERRERRRRRDQWDQWESTE